MRQYNKIFPALGMGLFFCSIYLGAAMAAANRIHAGSGMPPALLHALCVLTASLAFSLYLKRYGRLPRRLPLYLAAVSLICLAAPFAAPKTPGLSWQYLALPATALCLFLPVGFLLFFRGVPRHFQGITMGCALAAGELISVAILPLLHLHASVPYQPEPVHFLYSFACFATAATGLSFLAALKAPLWPWSRPGGAVEARNGQEPYAAPKAEPPAAAASPAPKPDPLASPAPANDGGPEGLAAGGLLRLFTGAALFFALLGLALGNLPRATCDFLLTGNAYFLLLLIAPTTGALLDGILPQPVAHALPRLLPVLVALPILAVPVLGLMQGFGLHGDLPLLLLAMRQGLQAALFIFAARLVGNSPFLPLVGTCAWSLIFFQFPGVLLAGVLEALPEARALAAFSLALAAIFCVRSFARQAGSLPRLATAGNGLAPPAEIMRPAGVIPPAEPASPTKPASPASPTKPAPPAEPASPQPEKDGAPPAPVPATDPVRLAAFAVAFDLSKREADVLNSLLRITALEDVGRELGISVNTVKFHIRGLLKKTAQKNRLTLARFYTAWKQEQATFWRGESTQKEQAQKKKIQKIGFG